MPVPMVGRAAALDELRRAVTRVRPAGRTVPAVITGRAAPPPPLTRLMAA